jgi:hypothetical protein
MSKALIFITFLIFFTLSACHSGHIYFKNSKINTGVDFSKGKWLLNTIDCPESTQEKLTAETLLFFNQYTKQRLFQISKVDGLLIPKSIPLNPNKNELKNLKLGTGFDYFINIKARKNKNDYGNFSLYESADSSGKNESSVIVEIYDLNLQEIIYSKTAIGVSGKSAELLKSNTQKSNKLIDNIEFYKNPNQLINGALKKIFKDLKKKSVK